jgi:release factor glutamine methyltransferase
VTVGEALDAARRRFLPVHGESARIDAVRLLEATLGHDSAWILAHDRDPLASEAGAAFEAAAKRREAGEPIAYIIGSAGFFGRGFTVSRDVLVPRPETELLAELAISHLRALGRPAPAVCDIGTGSGILAITLACEVEASRCTAVDISEAALAIARHNAAVLGVGARVVLLRGNLLDAVPGDARYDCIVANLPYVPRGEIAPVPDPVSFEPRLALDGGPDGLELYRRLFRSVDAHVEPKGAVFLEAGPQSAGTLARAAADAFPGSGVRIHEDYGRNPRIVEIRF